MSYTGTEIFKRAISILDELSDTGAVVSSQVSEYQYRAPDLLDLPFCALAITKSTSAWHWNQYGE